MSKSKGTHIILCIAVLSTQLMACEKILDVAAPANTISEENVFDNESTAKAFLTAIYTDMSKPNGQGAAAGFTGLYSLSTLCGLSSDELDVDFSLLLDYRATDYYQNNLSVTQTKESGAEFWGPLYNYIYRCNLAIAKLPKSTKISNATRNQLLGEAKFLRAFMYYYLVNLYGDVPLPITPDYEVNSHLKRQSAQNVYLQIKSDLEDAKNLLSENYLDETLAPYPSNSERVRPNKFAASALLSRVALITGDFATAVQHATELIDKTDLYALENINRVFRKDSKEAIWQIQPTTVFLNTEDAFIFMIPNTGMNDVHPFSLSQLLLSSFESNDQRGMDGNWIKSVQIGNNIFFYPYKYKETDKNTAVTSHQDQTEYLMIMRLAEQYLIRAEANLNLQNTALSLSDINVIRSRAGLPSITDSESKTIFHAIMQERFVEYFAELGMRWLDLKRTNLTNAVMPNVSQHKGGQWQEYQQLYPIPYSDIQKSPELMQNAGY